MIVNAMLQRINIALSFLEKNKEATTRFAKQIVPAGKFYLIVDITLQRIKIEQPFLENKKGLNQIYI